MPSSHIWRELEWGFKWSFMVVGSKRNVAHWKLFAIYSHKPVCFETSNYIIYTNNSSGGWQIYNVVVEFIEFTWLCCYSLIAKQFRCQELLLGEKIHCTILDTWFGLQRWSCTLSWLVTGEHAGSASVPVLVPGNK